MNDLTRTLLQAILKEKKAWKWEGRGKTKHPTTPNLKWIRGEYAHGWEGIWVDTVWLPWLARASYLLKVIKSGHPGYKDLEYVESHFDEVTRNGKDSEYLSCDHCALSLQMQLSDPYYRRGGTPFFHRIERLHPEWAFEDITQKLVDELHPEPEFTHQRSLL